MKQFEALTRKKDSEPVRYLIVDDSVFARKSLAKDANREFRRP